MRFILEHQKIRLTHTIFIHLNLDRAGIDFLTLIKTWNFPIFLERFRTDRRKIPEGYRFCRLVAIQAFAHIKIVLISLLNIVRFNRHIIENGIECRMPTMVTPISIYDPYLGNGRIAMFFITEILLKEADIRKIHRQSHVGTKLIQLRFAFLDKPG